MKKLFTPLFTLATLALQSQTPGYTATSIYDDFAQTLNYADPNPSDPNNPDGAYWWGKAATGTNPNNVNDPKNTDACYLANKYSLSRTGNGKLTLSVSQGSECWEPFGISTKLDLSNNSTFEVSITNTSNTAIYFDISLVDENKKVINANANGVNYSVASIAPQETKIFTGNFAGGQHKTWPGPQLSGGLDFSKVVEVDMTVVNASQPENNNWGPLAISDLSVQINSFKIGASAGSSISETFNNATFSIYPNPSSSGVITFSKNLSNVKMYNQLGELMQTATNASKLEVNTYAAGVYFIHSEQGISKVILQ